MDFTRITILAGAFGVGIGFGLQNVVQNFVAGLILLFARPVQVGDSVQTGDLQGSVRRIGIRASTLRSGEGADVIVPNSVLIAERVTNWTFSDNLRRIDLRIGVSYESDPARVQEVLLDVARAHPRVLTAPGPQALCMGFGESAISFELRVWTGRFDDWPAIRSDLAVSMHGALGAAGIRLPFPQHEVRLVGGAPASGVEPGPGLIVAAVLAITLDPALRMIFTHLKTFNFRRSGSAGPRTQSWSERFTARTGTPSARR